MTRIWKRVLAMTLVLTMLFGMLPTSVLAAEGDPAPVEEPAEHSHSYEAVVTAPGCTAGGYTTYTCACSDSYIGDETAATGHSWGEWVEAEGVKTRACALCGETEQETVTPPAVDEAVAAVQAMIEALPVSVADEAACAALEAQIAAVEEAVAALTAEQRSQLNTGKLTEAKAACAAWREQNYVNKAPETDPAVVEVQNMMDALDPVVDSEAKRDAIWAAMDVIEPAIEALTPDQQAQLDMSNYNAAIDAAAAYTNPEFDEDITWDLAGGWYWVDNTLYIKDGSITYAKLYAALLEKKDDGGHGCLKYSATNYSGFSSGAWDAFGETTEVKATSEGNVTLAEQTWYARNKSNRGTYTGGSTYTFTVKHYYAVTVSITGCDTGSVKYAGVDYTNGQTIPAVVNGTAITANAVSGYTTPEAVTVGSNIGSASFAYEVATQAPASVTITYGAGGTVLCNDGAVTSGTAIAINAGGDAVVVATPDPDYYAVIKVDGQPVGSYTAETRACTYTISAAASNKAYDVTVEFAKPYAQADSPVASINCFNTNVTSDNLAEVQEAIYVAVFGENGVVNSSCSDFTYSYSRYGNNTGFDALESVPSGWDAIGAHRFQIADGGTEVVRIYRAASEVYPEVNITVTVKISDSRTSAQPYTLGEAAQVTLTGNEET
ncbi:MAG: hypothetical protein IJE26_05050, partial [Oscillospiraceae bacterium]|nr:hypothetical protein [Oscillospiraceae bacterium]